MLVKVKGPTEVAHGGAQQIVHWLALLANLSPAIRYDLAVRCSKMSIFGYVAAANG